MRWLPLLLVVRMAAPTVVWAQTPAAAPATVRSLKVVPLAGNHEMNDLATKVMAPLVVQVLDQNDQPVEGADVMFRFPVEGPSATFPDHTNLAKVRTNADGQAAAIGWMANEKVGTFQVFVTALRGNEQGTATITMTNATRITNERARSGKHWYSTKWGRVALVAGAAGIAAAIVLAERGSGSKSTTPTVITATPGSPTIGGPQ